MFLGTHHKIRVNCATWLTSKNSGTLLYGLTLYHVNLFFKDRRDESHTHESSALPVSLLLTSVRSNLWKKPKVVRGISGYKPEDLGSGSVFAILANLLFHKMGILVTPCSAFLPGQCKDPTRQTLYKNGLPWPGRDQLVSDASQETVCLELYQFTWLFILILKASRSLLRLS